jgi:hypothetical protein
MSAQHSLRQALGAERLESAKTEASRRRLLLSLGGEVSDSEMENLLFVVSTLELEVFGLLDQADRQQELRAVAQEAFQIARVLPLPEDAIASAEWLVRLGCLATLGDRTSDFRRVLSTSAYPDLPLDDPDWGKRVWASVLDVWLRTMRKNGWEDLDAVQSRIVGLRRAQRDVEPGFLKDAEVRKDVRPAWELMTLYHLAKAAELLGMYLGQGSVEGHFDIREQLEAQFDRAVSAAARGRLIDLETTSRLLAKTSEVMVANSIWTVTRAVNSRVSRFVKSVTARDHARPIFEMLPPQRKTLREEGLLGSSKRSVVVSLPTSSGKTFISEFRILQALNQFDAERGWVAYLAPTRALVNQLTTRLRRDFSHLDFAVEKVSPALEVDGLEDGMLTETDKNRQFRILVTTPEKLDLMLRGGWEEKIGRPLTLVVVDEAHGLASSGRGIKLELLLATINRECRNAQFLLLTPFIENGERIAQWLAPDSHQSIEMGVDWTPNDRVIAISRVSKGNARGTSIINLHTCHTNRQTLAIPEQISLGEGRPLDMTFSNAKGSLSNIAAVTAQVLKERGTVIVLSDTLPKTWKIADTFKVPANRRTAENNDLKHIQRFMMDEMGESFPLCELLEYGVGVHNSGMSEDTRALVEWLTETGQLDVLVATTTIAQGVNFPVSGVVFASHQYRSSKHPFREEMLPEDFWNIAGRAGRVDQGDLGIIALAATDDAKQQELEQYIQKTVGELNSTLIEMVKAASDSGNLLSLERLSYQPGWSAFVQYLAHTYRQIDDHAQFAAQVEQVLRGTLGFQELRKSHRGWADQLVTGVHAYAERIKGKPLKLVDSTGFSWESVSNTLMRLGEEKLTHVEWSPDLFTSRREDLRRMMGVLLQVPELRENLGEVAGGTSNDGDKLSNIVCAWVHGQPLTEMANEFFKATETTDSADAMTNCCRKVFGRLTQTASWGLSALQSLTLGDSLEEMTEDQQRVIRNLPARIYYGVNSDEAIALRLLGVPRSAAEPLASTIQVNSATPLHQTRQRLRDANVDAWKAALGEKGESYHRVWSILEG